MGAHILLGVGKLRDLMSGYRASRSMKGMDQQALANLAAMTPGAGAAEGFDAAAHMERLAAAGLVSQRRWSRPTLAFSRSRGCGSTST